MEGDTRQLAIEWWAFAKSRDHYDREVDLECTVIYVSLAGELLDLESIELKHRLIKFANRAWTRINRNKWSFNRKLTAIYDLFVSVIEKESNRTFDIVHVKVQPPTRCHGNLPFDITGHPSCFVVKRANVITIDRIEEVEQ